jgi:hypothetical protein
MNEISELFGGSWSRALTLAIMLSIVPIFYKYTKVKKPKRKDWIQIAVFLLVIVGLLTWWLVNGFRNNSIQYDLKDWKIAFSKDAYAPIDDGGYEKGDVVLVSRSTGKNITLISIFDLKTKAQPNEDPDYVDGHRLDLFQSPNYGEKTYFGVDNYFGGGSVFSFNINTLSVQKLKNALYRFPDWDVAPLGNKSFFINRSTDSYGTNNTLGLYCFDTDTVKYPVIVLPQHETFSTQGFLQADEYEYNIGWTWDDNNTIKYGVYKDTDKKDNPLIRTVTVKLPDCE